MLKIKIMKNARRRVYFGRLALNRLKEMRGLQAFCSIAYLHLLVKCVSRLKSLQNYIKCCYVDQT